MEKFDYLILGGGISGITFARLLQLYTDKTFVILEKESKAGGLCRTDSDNGNHYDIGGGHFLYSKHKKVYDFIFSHIPENNFNKFERNTKIEFGKYRIDYPIEENIWQLPEDVQEKFLHSLFKNTVREYSGVKQYLLNSLGSEICEQYLFPYNEKMWGSENFENLSTEWLYKTPTIDIRKIISSIIYGKANKANVPSHEYFYYPKAGGFQVIFDSIAKSLEPHVRLNQNVEHVIPTITGGAVHVDKFIGEKVISTIPPTVFLNKVATDKLKHTSLAVTYETNPFKRNYQWLYTPDMSIDHHRQFDVCSYADQNRIRLLMKECNLNRFVSGQKYVKEYINEFAYPVPLEGKNEQMKDILRVCESMKIYSLGRWGTWQHHNSDVCIFNAMELFNRLEEKNI